MILYYVWFTIFSQEYIKLWWYESKKILNEFQNKFWSCTCFFIGQSHFQFHMIWIRYSFCFWKLWNGGRKSIIWIKLKRPFCNLLCVWESEKNYGFWKIFSHSIHISDKLCNFVWPVFFIINISLEIEVCFWLLAWLFLFSYPRNKKNVFVLRWNQVRNYFQYTMCLKLIVCLDTIYFRRNNLYIINYFRSCVFIDRRKREFNIWK